MSTNQENTSSLEVNRSNGFLKLAYGLCSTIAEKLNGKNVSVSKIKVALRNATLITIVAWMLFFLINTFNFGIDRGFFSSGFHPTSLLRQARLVEVAKGGRSRNDISDTFKTLSKGHAKTLRDAPKVAIITGPVEAADGNSRLPSFEDWTEVIELSDSEERTTEDPYDGCSFNINIKTSETDKTADTQNANNNDSNTKKVQIYKPKTEPANSNNNSQAVRRNLTPASVNGNWEVTEVSNELTAAEITCKVEFILKDKTEEHDYVEINLPEVANQLKNRLSNLWKAALDGKDVFHSGEIDADLVVSIDMNRNIESCKYGKKASKIPKLKGKEYAARLFQVLRTNGADQSVSAWLDRGVSNSQATVGAENPTAVDKEKGDPKYDIKNRFPFCGKYSGKCDEHISLVWYDIYNDDKNIFCIELKSNFGWRHTIEASFKMVDSSNNVTVPFPSTPIELYSSGGWPWISCPTRTGVTASQLADRFFPMHEQLYRSRNAVGDGKYKSAPTVEMLFVKRWIEAAIQDQLYFDKLSDTDSDFDPLSTVTHKPIDKAIVWARRINGSDSWGIIQVLIVVCFLYASLSLLLGYWCPSKFSVDVRALDQRFRFATRAIPLLGFVGTVIGISNSLAHSGNILSDNVQVRQSVVASMAQDLATAFDTTFIGLFFSIVLLVLEKFCRNRFVD